MAVVGRRLPTADRLRLPPPPRPEASDDELAHRPARRAFSGLLSARATVPEDRAKISALQGVLAGVFAEASAAE